MNLFIRTQPAVYRRKPEVFDSNNDLHPFDEKRYISTKHLSTPVQEDQEIWKRVGVYKKQPGEMAPIPIAVGQTLKDQSGRFVRIICVDRKDKQYPVVGLCEREKEKEEVVRSYSKFGRCQYWCDNPQNDLIPLTEETKETLVLVLDE